MDQTDTLIQLMLQTLRHKFNQIIDELLVVCQQAAGVGSAPLSPAPAHSPASSCASPTTSLYSTNSPTTIAPTTAGSGAQIAELMLQTLRHSFNQTMDELSASYANYTQFINRSLLLAAAAAVGQQQSAPNQSPPHQLVQAQNQSQAAAARLLQSAVVAAEAAAAAAAAGISVTGQHQHQSGVAPVSQAAAAAAAVAAVNQQTQRGLHNLQLNSNSLSNYTNQNHNHNPLTTNNSSHNANAQHLNNNHRRLNNGNNTNSHHNHQSANNQSGQNCNIKNSDIHHSSQNNNQTQAQNQNQNQSQNQNGTATAASLQQHHHHHQSLSAVAQQTHQFLAQTNSSIQQQQQLLATTGFNPLALVSCQPGQQTEILTPTHLKKAKLMFFYVRYPNSSTLKECFRDVRFNKANTAQLVKWFSNFREFYYIQMEKYARQAIEERVACKENLIVEYDHELLTTLNNHYNKNRSIELPEVFRQVVEETLRHFFEAIYTGKDNEQSWKKTIYKIIARLEQEVPDAFKTSEFSERLENQ